MICIDTTVLIDEFRAKGNPEALVNRFLLEHGSESLIVPAMAAGEFLDGARMISSARFREALSIFMSRKMVGVDFQTAQHYADIVSRLRVAKKLAGRSQNDLWTAATARQHGARLLTRNAAHFAGTPNLEILDYSFE